MKHIKLLAAVLSASLIISGCASDDNGYGGEFNVVISDNPENLDPQTAFDYESYYIIRNIYGTLMDINDNGMAVNGTAESYSVSGDGLVYTFKLREGLKWYGISIDGDVPLTAYDYEYAFRRMFDSKTQSPHIDTFSNIKNSLAVYCNVKSASELGVKADDEYTLTITLEKPNCDFLKLLAHPAASPCNEELFLSTKGRYGLSAEYTYGCGAFYVSDWNYDPYWTDNHIELMKITDNSLDGYETFPKSVFFKITDDRNAFEKNENILVDTYSIESIDEYTKDIQKNYKCKDYISSVTCFFFSPSSPISQDENARKALLSIIDMEKIHSELGADSLPSTGFLPNSITVMNSSLRDIYPEISAISDGDISYWHSFVAENNNIDFNSSIILVSDKVKSVSAVHSIISDFEEKADLYCTAVFEDDKKLKNRMKNGDYTFCIDEISAGYNSAESFFDEISEYLSEYMSSDMTLHNVSYLDISTKSTSIKDTEEELLVKAYTLPLSFDKEYILVEENVSDIWYDPFTDITFFKYAKK